MNLDSEPHSLRLWASDKQAQQAGRNWPRAYPVEIFVGRWALYRTCFNAGPDDEPVLTAACTCGDFH